MWNRGRVSKIEMGKNYTMKVLSAQEGFSTKDSFDGRPVRVLCVDRKSTIRPVVVAALSNVGTEEVFTMTSEGETIVSGFHYGLEEVMPKVKGWANVYLQNDKFHISNVYETIEDARGAIVSNHYLGQVFIDSEIVR